MNIPAIVKSAVDVAFKVFDSIAVDAIYFRVTPAPYNPATGLDSSTEQQIPCRVLFGVFAQDEVDGQNIQHGDEKIFIKQSEVTAEPQKDDYIVKADGTRYDVFYIGIEPTKQLWIVRGRAHRS